MAVSADSQQLLLIRLMLRRCKILIPLPSSFESRSQHHCRAFVSLFFAFAPVEESPVRVCILQDLNKRQGLALLVKMGESVKHVTGGYKLRARPIEFAAMGDYLDVFTQKLGTIDRIAQRIIKEQSGTAS